MREKIRDAAVNQADVRPLAKLNVTQFGGRLAAAESLRQVAASSNPTSWPLFETEEEWVTWEENWLANGAGGRGSKGKERETNSLRVQPTLSSREKVANWQASLQTVPSSVSLNTVPQTSQSKSDDTGNALGFRAKKRTLPLNDVKVKSQTHQLSDSLQKVHPGRAESLQPQSTPVCARP